MRKKKKKMRKTTNEDILLHSPAHGDIKHNVKEESR